MRNHRVEGKVVDFVASKSIEFVVKSN